jgi:UDP-2,3-diacylglucosamine pyrophosphatase LpxH
MTNIRYVCFSDMHFGDEGSLLTHLKAGSPGEPDPSAPSEVLVRLVECLRTLLSHNEKGKRPTLVLNGDILELALATDATALMTFQRFLELAFAPDDQRLFSDIIYLPGNHDHHIWETAREKQYADFLAKLPPTAALPSPWHTTALTLDERHPPVVPYLIDTLIKYRVGVPDVPVAVAYPNFAEFSADGKKAVIFSHGHYIESIYHLVSQLKTYLFPGSKIPEVVYHLEEENFAWIDFFWSMMGRQGEAGRDVEIVYKSLQDEKQVKVLVDNLANSLIAASHQSPIKAFAEAPLLKGIFHALVDIVMKHERKQLASPDDKEPLTKEGEDGLAAYMIGPMRRQILDEGHALPEEISFVFGHTHKPFEENRPFVQYQRDVDVYNTGGWVIETKDASEVHGGAVVLVDDNLDVASLHMFHDLKEGQPAVKVSWPDRDKKKAPNAFQQRLFESINPAVAPWAGFSKAAAEAVAVRRANLIAMIEKRQ